MKKIVLVLSLIAVSVVSCVQRPSQQELLNKIGQEFQTITMVDIASEDATAHQLVDDMVAYADQFPEDTANAAKFLMAAADISCELGDVDTAISFLDRVIIDYPDYDELSQAYLSKGQIYERGERYEDAIEAYNEYLNLFPDDPLADAVKKMLPYVGMPAEETLEMVLQQSNAMANDFD